MKYGNVPGIKKQISRLVQGTVMIGPKNLDYSMQLLDEVFAAGCNTFDSAQIYGGGDCERALGKWMTARGLRERVVVLTKGAHMNADRKRVTPFDITADLHDSLARLQTDYIDLYVLHRDNPDLPVGPIVDILNEHLKAGRIRAFGGSNWTHRRLQEANEYAKARKLVPFAVSSPNYSLADQVIEPWRDCISISGPKGLEARQWYASTQMPVFAWSSLAGGFWSGRFGRESMAAQQGPDKATARCYGSEDNLLRLDRVKELAKDRGLSVPQVAMAFIMNQPLNLFALVGCRSGQEFQDNLKALDVKLTEQELAWLDLQADSR